MEVSGAGFAEKHGMDFGRLIVGRKKNGKLQVVDVSDPLPRKKALQMTSGEALESLFADHSSSKS